MDTAQFLARVVAPGNYLAVCFKSPERGMGTRFFPRDNVAEAASFIRWCAAHNMDVWHAVASYRMAEPDGNNQVGQKYRGERTQANAQALKCFWIDIDIKRDDDKKQIENVYADVTEAVTWLTGFMTTTQMPHPNLWVRSGYGLHVYWVLEDAIPPQEWQPYADALKAALQASNAKLDVGISADSARILRPPKTNNLKVPGTPAPVFVLDKQTRGDYPNELIYQRLQPYVGAIKRTVNSNYSSGNLVGAPPTILTSRQSNSTAAARSNIPSGRRDHLFSRIASQCNQVKLSLANNGLGENRPLWYLGNLTLAHFCIDGSDFVHEIGRADLRYTAAETDAAVQQIATDQLNKGFGAPTCAHYDSARSGICQTCPHYGRVTSPYTLGVDSGDLPDEYRRGNNCIEHEVVKKGVPGWDKLIGGDVYGPALDRVGDVYMLTFTYERAGKTSSVIVNQATMPVEAGASKEYFGLQGVTMNRHTSPMFGDFVLAWIDKLRDMCAERADAVPPFGWAIANDGEYAGFSVGGTFYKADGSEQPAPGGDEKLVRHYKPRGTLAAWRAACDFVTAGRPDLQVLVGASFGAPLMEFTGHNGMVFSAWSRDSAVGKSSAFRLGTTVWSSPHVMCSMEDTVNSVRYRIGQSKVMPCYWDEIQVTKDTAAGTVQMFYALGQGKDKGRLNANVTLKDAGDWKTILIASGNRPLMEYVLQERGDSDAGALRLFEFLIEHPTLPLNPQAARIIASSEVNSGQAGRVYAAWLAQNHQTASKLVLGISEQLRGMVGGYYQGERFFIAGMACVIAGASIAHSLELATFDVSAMTSFLIDAFQRLRVARSTNLTVNNGVVDIGKIFGNFFADNASTRMVTSSFTKPGRPDPKFRVVWFPARLGDRLSVHVGQQEKMMRIDKEVWKLWCRMHNYSADDLQRQMEKRWHALQRRGMMGGGTQCATGQVEYIELPLLGELAAYLFDYNLKVSAPGLGGTP